MTTNREWLYGLDVADLADWFDADHVDATCDNSGENVTHDSREKLLADLEKQVRVWHDYDGNFMRIYDSVAYAQVKELLDRQAAIIERELCKQCDWPSLAAQPDYESQGRIVALTAKVDELTAERDALADDLLTCNKEREEYRELFSESLTLAAEIVNLQP